MNAQRLVNAIEGKLGEYALHFIAIFLALMLIFAIRDYAMKALKGIAFYFSKEFNEQDKVFIDGERARIIHIGMTKTKFLMENGEDEYYIRVVQNERLAFLNLKRIYDK